MSKITFTERAFEEYLYWQTQDKKTLKRINRILKELERGEIEGIGKPEALSGTRKNTRKKDITTIYGRR